MKIYHVYICQKNILIESKMSIHSNFFSCEFDSESTQTRNADILKEALELVGIPAMDATRLTILSENNHDIL